MQVQDYQTGEYLGWESQEPLTSRLMLAASDNLLSGKLNQHMHIYCQTRPPRACACSCMPRGWLHAGGLKSLHSTVLQKVAFFCLIGQFQMNSFLSVGACWISVLREPRCNTVHFLNFKVPETTGLLPLSGEWHLLAYALVKIAGRCLRHLQM